VAAALVGAGAVRLSDRIFNGRREAETVGVLTLALLALFTVLNVRGIDEPSRREAYAGMVTPDPRPYVGFQRAMEALSRYGNEVLTVHDSPAAMVLSEGIEDLWRFRGLHSVQMSLDWARGEMHHSGGVSVILVRRHPEKPIDPARSGLWPPDPPGVSILAGEQGKPAWFAAQTQRRRLLVAIDPDETQYIAYRVGREP
jgi:hypothetical protein